MSKSEALRLADELDAVYEDGADPDLIYEAAAELRRLHAENEALRNVANRGGHIAVAVSRIADLEAQRDALLEALRRIAMASEATVCNQEWIAKTARAAIKAVEETK